MSPSARIALGVVLFLLVIGSLWMFWQRPDRATGPAKDDPVKGAVALTSQPAATPDAKSGTRSDVTADAKPAATSPAAPAAPKAEAPRTVLVYFDFDRSALRPGEAPKLDELTAKVKGEASVHLGAAGYADRIGEAPYNTALSTRRAEAVVAYLVGKGMDAGRIHAEGKGEDLSPDPCTNLGPENGTNQKLVDCLQHDRRVEITLN